MEVRGIRSNKNTAAHNEFFFIHFGFENMSFALNIGKNAKPGFSHGPNPGFQVWKMAGLPGFGETRV